MVGTAVICVTALALLCAVHVQGSKKKVDGAPSVGDGFYDGRFALRVGVQAVFSQGGVFGNVLFTQENSGAPVKIHVNLMGLDQSPDGYRWSIHDFPVRTSLLREYPCADDKLGGVFNPGNVAAAAGNLTSLTRVIRPDRPWQVFETDSITLSGPNSIIGRSLVIDKEGEPGGAFICSNIEQLGVRREILKATFDNPIIQGDVVIRYALGRDDALVEADLYSVGDSTLNSGGNNWTINYARPGRGNVCNITRIGMIVGFFPDHHSEFTCSQSNQRECFIGDQTGKCGALEFVNGRARVVCSDSQLGTVPPEYLFDKRDPESALLVVVRNASGAVLGCSQLESVAPQVGRTQIRTRTIAGDFVFWQTGPDDRTYVRAHVTGLRGRNYALRVYTNMVEGNKECTPENLGDVFSKPGGEFVLPGNLNGPPTNDASSIGNLDALLTLEEGQKSLRTTVTSSFLPLFGPYSIQERTLGLLNEMTGKVEACGVIMRDAEYPPSEVASLQGFQDQNNPPLPEIVSVRAT